MKKLIVFLSLVAVLQAKVNIAYSVNTFHLKTDSNANWSDYKLNNDNKMLTVEYESDKNIVGLSLFKNSYFNDSVALTFRQKFDRNNKGWYGIITEGIIKGYHKYELLPSMTDKNKEYQFINPGVFYEDFSLICAVGMGYTYKRLSVETNVFGAAIITSLKYSI